MRRPSGESVGHGAPPEPKAKVESAGGSTERRSGIGSGTDVRAYMKASAINPSAKTALIAIHTRPFERETDCPVSNDFEAFSSTIHFSSCNKSLAVCQRASGSF